MCLTGWLLTLICVYVYDIIDDTSAMWDNWPIGSWHHRGNKKTVGTQNCFSNFDSCFTPLHALYQHQNKRPECTIARQNQKISPHWGGGYPLPRPYPLGAVGASILAPWALGVPVTIHLTTRLANRPGTAGFVPELTHGVSKKWRLRHWSVSLWRDPDDVPHCRILSPGKTEWRLISATLCRWRRCFVADQLWFMTRIREVSK